MNYETEYKGHYRRGTWSGLEDASYVGIVGSKVFILDTAAALETRFLIEELGVSPTNITVCNRSPAHVASVRRAYPDISTVGLPAHRAFAVVAKNSGGIHHANLDFCAQLSWPILNTMRCLGLSGMLGGDAAGSQRRTKGVKKHHPKPCFAVTLLGAREHVSTRRLISRIAPDAIRAVSPPDGVAWGVCSENDRGRLAIAAVATGLDVEVTRAWKYRSPSGQPMVCGVFRSSGAPKIPITPRPPHTFECELRSIESRIRDHQAYDERVVLYDRAVRRFDAWKRCHDAIGEFLMSCSEAAC